jgi:hypothetical protein
MVILSHAVPYGWHLGKWLKQDREFLESLNSD